MDHVATGNIVDVLFRGHQSLGQTDGLPIFDAINAENQFGRTSGQHHRIAKTNEVWRGMRQLMADAVDLEKKLNVGRVTRTEVQCHE